MLYFCLSPGGSTAYVGKCHQVAVRVMVGCQLPAVVILQMIDIEQKCLIS